MIRPGPAALALALLATVPATGAEPSQAGASSGPEGAYEGTGRACAGALRISPQRLTWRSSFSQCSGPAVLLERQSQGEGARWVYELAKPQKRCLYRVVMLERKQAAGEPVFWNASGFPSVEAYRAGSNDARLSCYLVKLR